MIQSLFYSRNLALALAPGIERHLDQPDGPLMGVAFVALGEPPQEALCTGASVRRIVGEYVY
jgi:hypothetical protein